MAANPMASRSAALAGAAQALNKPKAPGGDFRQNLSGATGGTIKGANGGTQQLGSAALRRLGNPAAPTGPNMAGGGLNPAVKQPPSRTPPIMDPMQNPGSAGAVGSGSVDSSIPGDPNARMTSTAPGGQLFQPPPGMQPGSDGNMGGAAGPTGDLISKLSGAGYQSPVNIGSALPGFQSPMQMNGDPGRTPFGPASDPGGRVNIDGAPGSTPWMPPGTAGNGKYDIGLGGPMPLSGPNMHGGGLNGDQAPDAHGGGGYLGGTPPFTRPVMEGGMPGGSPGGRPPMNTKPLPGAPDQPPTGAGGGVWGRIAGAGGPQQPKPRFPSSGGNMASF